MAPKKKPRRAAEASGGLEVVPASEPLPFGRPTAEVQGRKRRAVAPEPVIQPEPAAASAPVPPASGGKRRLSRGERRQMKREVAAPPLDEASAAAAAAAAPPSVALAGQRRRAEDASVAVGEPAGRKLKRKGRKAAGAAVAAAGPASQAASSRPEAKGCADSAKNTFVPKDGPYTYEPDPEDHCETDIRAYQHLRPLLRQLEKTIYGKNAGELKIWDPYYCDGAVARNLATLGFPKTHNRNEDFYAVLASKKLPAHDVLVTSPPYSEDHIERCMKHCAFSGKAWCVLLPNWVSQKEYFQELLRTAPALVGARPEYLGPVGRPYHYWFPKGASQRPDHVEADGKTTPYSSSWCIFLPGSVGGMRLMRNLEAQQKSSGQWVTAKTVKGLKWSARKVEERNQNAEARVAARLARHSKAGASAGLRGERLGRGANRKRRRPGAGGFEEDDEDE